MGKRLEKLCDALRDKSVAVLGAGVSNKPLIHLLLEGGVPVTVRDKGAEDSFPPELLAYWRKKGAALVLGEGYLDGLHEDVIFRSPGIMPHTPQVADAVAGGSALTSEMEVFMALCPCPIVAVTGSDGKTTTTTIIAGLLKAAGYEVYTGGNIGTPLLDKVDGMEPTDKMVLELSSFQLMTMSQSPHVAVVTNVAPNHLDKHTDMAEYVNAKKRIFLYQSAPDRVILNADNDLTRAFAQEARGAVTWFSRQGEPEGDAVFLRDGVIWKRDDTGERRILFQKDILLPGDHNVENYMAAIAAVGDWVSAEVIQGYAKTFGGVEHRIELVREVNGVRYYNDSIASSPTRTIAGLRAFDKRVILIAGGYDKHIPFDVLGPEVVAHVKELFLTGDTAAKIRRAVEEAPGYDAKALPIRETADLQEAVRLAYETARPGDVVLMSPACASFDRFRNFMERGDAFKTLVNELKERT